MKNPRSLGAALLLLALSFTNCKEKENVIPQTQNNDPADITYFSIEDVFDDLKLKPKTVTIDADKDASFYGNSGTRFILKANSLTTMDGTLVTGEVQINVTEYLEKGDMLFSKTLPISNGEPLISGGELNISAEQSGKPLRLADGKTVQANIPQNGTPDKDMGFFIGEQKKGDDVNLVNWVRPKVDTAGQFNQVVWTHTADTLSIISDTLAYANADRFFKNPDYQSFTVTVKIPGINFDSTIRVFGYAIYRDYNGMWPLYTYYYNKGYFQEGHVAKIRVNFVLFALINGEFYGGITAATPENGKTYEVILSKTDAAIFKQKVNDL